MNKTVGRSMCQASGWRHRLQAAAMTMTAAACMATSAGSAQAAVFTTSGVCFQWDQPGCWTPAGVPSFFDTARIGNLIAVVEISPTVTRLEVLPAGRLGLIASSGGIGGLLTTDVADIAGQLLIGKYTFSSAAFTQVRSTGGLRLFDQQALVTLGEGSLLNQGMMQLERGRITGTGAANLTNSGTMNVLSSTIDVPQFSQSGTLKLGGSNESTLTVNSDQWTNSGTINLQQPVNPILPVIQGSALLQHDSGQLTGTGRVLNAIQVRNGSISPAEGLVLALEGPVEFKAPASVQVSATPGTLLEFKNDVRFGGTNFHQFVGGGATSFAGEVQLGPEIPVGVRLLLVGSGTLEATSKLFLRLGAGGMSDSLQPTGGLLLQPGSTLSFTSIDGNPLAIGSSFTLFPDTALSGSFTTISATELPLASGAVLDLSRLYIDGTLSVVAVPEPGTWLMLGAGLMCVAWRRRRRPAAD